MKSRCDTCGGWLRYTARPFRKCRATPKEQGAIVRATLPKYDRDAIRRQLDAFGYDEVWVLSHTCPGCGTRGTWGQEYERDDAERRADAQNLLLETPEAQFAAEHWQDEVERRAQQDAREFADAFVARFPRWADCLTFHDPSENGIALAVRIPSENPEVPGPLTVHVSNGEALVAWSDAHNHFYREHQPSLVERALDSIAELTDETLVVYGAYRDGRCAGGGGIAPGEVPKGWSDARLVYRSWRGTHDRTVPA